MKFTKVVARFDAIDISVAEELICDIFFSFNLKGVICDIPLDEPDEGFGTNTLAPPEIYSVTGFLPLLDSTDIQVENIKKQAEELSAFNIDVKILTQVVDENEWADAWKDYFEVTKITDRIIVKPDWKEYHPTPEEHVIHLDPGMAFGTGTHPTTSMCIKLIDRFLKPGSNFLDIGCGSGILMVAAAHLGAGNMFGLDNDPVAIDITRENLDKNSIDPSGYELECTTLDSTKNEKHDFIAANIIAQVIVDIMPQIADRMADHTIVVLSGIIKERLGDVMAALKANNLTLIHEEFEDEWVALAVKKHLR